MILIAPGDKFSRTIGSRWYDNSGAKILQKESKFSYEDYCEYAPISEEDRVQIEKDLVRTSGNSFAQSSINSFLGQLDQKTLTRQVSSILYAFVRRNPDPGYAQGTHSQG